MLEAGRKYYYSVLFVLGKDLKPLVYYSLAEITIKVLPYYFLAFYNNKILSSTIKGIYFSED